MIDFPEKIKKCAIVCQNSDCYYLFAEQLAQSINALGVEAKSFLSKGYLDVDEIKKYDPECVIVICPIDGPIPYKKKGVIWIAIQTEPLYFEGNGPMMFGIRNNERLKIYLNCYDIVFDYMPSNIAFIKKHCPHITVKSFPFPLFTGVTVCDDINCNTDYAYDICFIGVMSARREKILAFLEKKYSINYIHQNIWGKEKVKEIRSSRICLNIHREEGCYSEICRMLDLALNKAFIMSDYVDGGTLFENGEDYVQFTLYDLTQKIDYYLEHEEERRRISENAYAKAHKYSMEDNALAIISAASVAKYQKGTQIRQSKEIRKMKIKYGCVRIKRSVIRFLS